MSTSAMWSFFAYTLLNCLDLQSHWTWDLQNIFSMVLQNTETINFSFHEVMASTNQHFILIFLRKSKKRENPWTFKIYMMGRKKKEKTSWKRQPSCPLSHLLLTNKMLLWSIQSLFSEHFLLLFFPCIYVFLYSI